MTRGGRVVLTLAVAAVALLAPAAASAHAYLVKTVPQAAGIVDVSPPVVALTYDEAVEPRFAIISVSNAQGHQVTDGTVRRAAGNPDTLVVPLKPHLPEGWYLVYWRVISVDGHPVQSAFTFAVGPNPGPAPQFPIPHIGGTATTPQLLAARWVMFLTVMTAIGLLVLRIGILRPVARRVEGIRLRAVSTAFVVASALGLIAIPVYLDYSTSVDSLRPAWDVGALVPLFRVTAFGRGYVDMEICFALFCVAAWVALWVDHPEREHRSIAELMAGLGALFGAVAVLLIPGTAGHAAQTAPRVLAVLLDWLHLTSGSIWVGGLIGLLVFWASLPAGRRVAALSVAVPRFSNVAFVSVLVLLASGTWATVLHMPILSAMWTTSYGQVILIKIGLLAVAMLVASVNLVRTKPRLAAARKHPELGKPAATLLRRLVTVEAVLVTATVFGGALLSSLPPPAAALAREGSADAKAGPGPILTTVHKNGYTVRVRVSPNHAVAPNTFTLMLTKGGSPVSKADVTLTFLMLDMTMGNQEYRLGEITPGVYSHSSPALVMVGHWGLAFQITPPGEPSFQVLIVDHATG